MDQNIMSCFDALLGCSAARCIGRYAAAMVGLCKARKSREQMKFLVAIGTGLVVCSGCASIVSKSSYPVTINSQPSGATVTIKNNQGTIVQRTTTPSSVMLKASDRYFRPANYSFEFEKNGYGSANDRLSASMDGWYIGNILLGGFGLIGFLVIDPATGAMYKLEDKVSAALPDDVSALSSPSRPELTSLPDSAPNDAEDFSEHPHQGRTAAVLAFDGRGGLSVDETALLTDRFSVELGRAAVYRLVSQSKMKEVLEMQQFSAACNALECAVEAGQLLGVEYIVYGSIGRIGMLYTINVYVTSVERGDIVASETVDHRGDIESLLTQGMGEAMSKLLMKTMDDSK